MIIKHSMVEDLSHKGHNTHVPYPTEHHSEHKCAHFCSEWCIVGYGTSALLDMLTNLNAKVENRPYNVMFFEPQNTLHT